MNKTIRFTSILLASILIICSCAPRRDFCDCMNITKAVTDGFTLSEKELEEKEKGCEWIQKELSQMEQLNKMANCISSPKNSIRPKTNATSNSQDESPQTTDWEFVTNAVGKTTNDIQFMNIPFVQNRLKDLLKNRYQDLDEIYRNSIAYEIFQSNPQSDNYWISFTNENNPQSFNCRIVINPNLDIINVLLKYNDKVDTFFERNIKLKGIFYNPEYKDWNADGL